MARQTFQLALYERALEIAADEKYDAEVVSTEMVHIVIGESGDYADKAEWIESQIDDWLTRAGE